LIIEYSILPARLIRSGGEIIWILFFDALITTPALKEVIISILV
jgi:hypothetical protein